MPRISEMLRQNDEGVARAWVFTLPNYDDDDISKLREFNCRYLVYGKEVAPTTGTPHLQGYVYFTHSKSLRTLKRYFPRAHFEPAIASPEQNRDYCVKDGDWFERGEIPRCRGNGGDNQRARWERMRDLVKQGSMHSIAEEEPKIWIMHYKTLKTIERDHMIAPPNTVDVCGEWYYGEPGAGKSHHVRELYPNYYDKLLNKWWDGYQNEMVVLLDDFDKNHSKLGSHLKRWADKYHFKAEVKGGAMNIRPVKIVVTSNYSPNDIWADDPPLLAAIRRRFKVIHFHDWRTQPHAYSLSIDPQAQVLPEV